MKKYISLLIVCVLCFAACSCGGITNKEYFKTDTKAEQRFCKENEADLERAYETVETRRKTILQKSDKFEGVKFYRIDAENKKTSEYTKDADVVKKLIELTKKLQFEVGMRSAMVQPGVVYYYEFVDNNGETVSGFNIGNINSISTNEEAENEFASKNIGCTIKNEQEINNLLFEAIGTDGSKMFNKIV